ncbi:Rieske 2Fe-2S domain-containing protein [Neisseriaceae bacterium JH1-16]|nr:Rieske 2Fe-2S domain-containing protein [Neisseriaceae bacterium JH1-16]
MATTATGLICRSDELVDGGLGVRFSVTLAEGREAPAFVIRHQGTAYGWLNACRHQPAQLDWKDGEFFDVTGQHLVCSMHGALYQPDSGLCVAGPCRGAKLVAVPVTEADGEVWLGA